jgi:YidC/Oxa1 family membrane protein insertase
MGKLFEYIAEPLGMFLNLIYNTIAFHNYGLAIIFFTLLIRLLLLPLSIKQYRSTAKMQEIQPQLQEIQKKYKNNKEKMNQEILALYQENKVNPAGGCLPLIVQMPILISLYWVIQSPLKYMFNKTADVITQLYNAIPADAIEKLTNLKDISIINYFSNNIDKLQDVSGLLSESELIDLNFLGIFNLGLIPTSNFGKLFGPLSSQYLPLVFIPILAALTTFLSIRYSTPRSAQKASNDTGDNVAKSMQSTMYVMPVITGFVAFSVPAGLGLYWIISSLVQILQQMYMNKFIIKKKEVVDK